MSAAVVRRFELRVEGRHTLDDAMVLVRALVEQESPEVRAARITPVERLDLLEVRLEGSADAVSRVMARIAANRHLRIHRDLVRAAATAPDRLEYPDGDALLRMGITPGGGAPPPGPSPGPVTVAVVDSGIMVDHPDLSHSLWTGTVNGRRAHGARCIGGTRDPDVTDEDGHGTRLAGTILAVTGGAPGVQLMAVKFFDGDTLPGPANAADAIDFAMEQRAHIINLSWALEIGSAALERAIQRACDGGALLVIAAGNAGSDNDDCAPVPARYARHNDSIITVMATNQYDEKPSFSNYGKTTVDLAAPGVDVVTTRAAVTAANGPWRRHRRYDGTSAAAAHVTGAAALLKSRDSSLSAQALKACLHRSVDPLPGLKCATGGRLNLGTALARC